MYIASWFVSLNDSFRGDYEVDVRQLAEQLNLLPKGRGLPDQLK